MHRNVLITCEGQMWFGAAVQSGLAWFGPGFSREDQHDARTYIEGTHRLSIPYHTVWFYHVLSTNWLPSILYTSHGKSWQVYTRNDDQRLDWLRIQWWANPYLPVFRMCLLGHSSQHNKHLLSPCFSPTSDRCWHRRR